MSSSVAAIIVEIDAVEANLSEKVNNMKRSTLLFVAVALLFVSVAASPASAQGFGRRRGLGFGIAGGTSFSTIWDLYLNGSIPVPPYFALHPPVYYSAPIPRTYGYSPFAYPGTVPTPEIVTPAEPEVIENPHVQQTKSQPLGDKTAAVTWEVIRNPFASGGQAERLASFDSIGGESK